MSTASAYLTVAGLGVDVIYKDIKNLHISVYPPVGRVRVAAPQRTDEDTIRLAVVQRLPWIKRQRAQLQNAERQSERRMLSGETHYVWGQRYQLDVSRTSGHYSVEAKGKTLWVVTPAGTDSDGRRSTLDRWYRRELKAAVAPLMHKWQPLIGVEANKVVVRRMKTKWGSCVAHSRTIWLNPELAKKNPRCLEYIVVHELTHLLERGHGERFLELMDQFMPDWRVRRDELNSAPLAEESWS
ncbi:M48 family metallopeptidase [Nocardioides sp. J2M5]|uniref:M48 family metallopeptidase n=1 Tax=Nocardioides palaemonis TaxID=2829810 RepID=UPI001BAA85C3|nr:SprT family zinc-dependent metalloprotease [Nocardioides palaemonis]MBS2940187.1 M48 family metallopeptidase [Nocardioides palaemonis]